MQKTGDKDDRKKKSRNRKREKYTNERKIKA
jgi:hypothetical protein